MNQIRTVLMVIILFAFLMAFGFGDGTSAQWKGTKQFGTIFNDEATGIVTDSIGNIYVVGWTTGDLDGNINAGGADAFVLKYNQIGEKQWSKQFGTASDDYATGVATDTAGNIYVTGYIKSRFDSPKPSKTAIFLKKYNSDGEAQWFRQMEMSPGDEATGVATNSNGDIYVVGYTKGLLNGDANAGGTDVFVIKYDAESGRNWNRQFGTVYNDEPCGVATDTSGNIYVAGNSEGRLDGNPGNGDDVFNFLVKFNRSGEKQWGKQFEDAPGDILTGISTNSNGNIFLAGRTIDEQVTGIRDALKGDANARKQDNINAGEPGNFIIKYDPIGERKWVKQFGIRSLDYVTSIATDTKGNVYMLVDGCGKLDGSSKVVPCCYIIKYTSVGDKGWSRQFVAGSNYKIGGIATDISGNIYVTGSIEGRLDGNTNAGLKDVFIVKSNSAGEKQ